MKVLNLSPEFDPFEQLDKIVFEAFTFSGGEPHIKLDVESFSKTDSVMITIRMNQFNDLGFLLMATDTLRRTGINKVSVFIPYFPGARQDRLMTSGEPLSVKVYADIINTQGYEEVIILDPHSDVAPALLNRVRVVNNHSFVQSCLPEGEDIYLISPDAGAQKKSYQLSKSLGGIPVVKCDKERDVLTGELSGFVVHSQDLGGRDCYIVDDICDGGGTFLGLAQELRKKNAGRLFLIVTHGIFSKGLSEIQEQYDRVFTTNSIGHQLAEVQTIFLRDILKNTYR